MGYRKIQIQLRKSKFSGRRFEKLSENSKATLHVLEAGKILTRNPTIDGEKVEVCLLILSGQIAIELPE